MEHKNLEIIRVRKVKLNPDHETAKVVFDVRVDDKNGRLTIPKVNLLTTKISDLISHERVFDNKLFPHKTNREIKVDMLLDLDDKGSAFTIKMR